VTKNKKGALNRTRRSAGVPPGVFAGGVTPPQPAVGTIALSAKMSWILQRMRPTGRLRMPSAGKSV